jgi:hypothetical protein
MKTAVRRTAPSRCPLCRQVQRFNRRTLEGFRESDAEIERDLASRRSGGPGTMKAYASLDDLFASLHAL